MRYSANSRIFGKEDYTNDIQRRHSLAPHLVHNSLALQNMPNSMTSQVSKCLTPQTINNCLAPPGMTKVEFSTGCPDLQDYRLQDNPI